MLIEVPAGNFFVRRVNPLDLSETGAGCLEMREVQTPGLVVMGQVSEPPPVRGGLDEGEGRIGKARDPGPTPLFG